MVFVLSNFLVLFPTNSAGRPQTTGIWIKSHHAISHLKLPCVVLNLELSWTHLCFHTVVNTACHCRKPVPTLVDLHANFRCYLDSTVLTVLLTTSIRLSLLILNWVLRITPLMCSVFVSVFYQAGETVQNSASPICVEGALGLGGELSCRGGHGLKGQHHHTAAAPAHSQTPWECPGQTAPPTDSYRYCSHVIFYCICIIVSQWHDWMG